MLILLARHKNQMNLMWKFNLGGDSAVYGNSHRGQKQLTALRSSWQWDKGGPREAAASVSALTSVRPKRASFFFPPSFIWCGVQSSTSLLVFHCNFPNRIITGTGRWNASSYWPWLSFNYNHEFVFCWSINTVIKNALGCSRSYEV